MSLTYLLASAKWPAGTEPASFCYLVTWFQITERHKAGARTLAGQLWESSCGLNSSFA